MTHPNRPTPEALDSISEEMKAGIYCTQEEVEEMLEKGDSVTTHLHNRLYQDLVDVYMAAYWAGILAQLKDGSLLPNARLGRALSVAKTLTMPAGGKQSAEMSDALKSIVYNIAVRKRLVAELESELLQATAGASLESLPVYNLLQQQEDESDVIFVLQAQIERATGRITTNSATPEELDAWARGE